MPAVTLGTVLDRARAFEVRMAKYYARVRDQSTDNGTRLLTYYLARHRRHQDQAWAGYDEARVTRLRKTELADEIAFDPEKRFPLPGARPDSVTGKELLHAALDYDQALMDLYRSILRQPLGDEVHGMLELLVLVEERDVVMMKKMLTMHYF